MSQDPTQNDWSCDSQGTDVPHGTSHNALETNHEKTPGDIRELLKDNLGVSEQQLSLVPDGQLLHAKEFLADARVPPHVRFPIHERIVEPQEDFSELVPNSFKVEFSRELLYLVTANAVERWIGGVPNIEIGPSNGPSERFRVDGTLAITLEPACLLRGQGKQGVWLSFEYREETCGSR